MIQFGIKTFIANFIKNRLAISMCLIYIYNDNKLLTRWANQFYSWLEKQPVSIWKTCILKNRKWILASITRKIIMLESLWPITIFHQ